MYPALLSEGGVANVYPALLSAGGWQTCMPTTAVTGMAQPGIAYKLAEILQILY